MHPSLLCHMLCLFKQLQLRVFCAAADTRSNSQCRTRVARRHHLDVQAAGKQCFSYQIKRTTAACIVDAGSASSCTAGWAGSRVRANCKLQNNGSAQASLSHHSSRCWAKGTAPALKYIGCRRRTEQFRSNLTAGQSPMGHRLPACPRVERPPACRYYYSIQA